MKDILFSVILFVASLLMIFVSKVIMYKVFKCNDYKKNIYCSSIILAFISFIVYVLLTYFISSGNGYDFSLNLSSFSLVYFVSLFISVIINCICEVNIYKNKRFVYIDTKKKKSIK